MSVDMDVVGVMAAYLPVVSVCTALYRECRGACVCVCVCTALSREAKHCISLPDDGSLVIQNTLEHFKYFIIILIVSTNYIFVHLLDNKVFYRSRL